MYTKYMNTTKWNVMLFQLTTNPSIPGVESFEYQTVPKMEQIFQKNKSPIKTWTGYWF